MDEQENKLNEQTTGSYVAPDAARETVPEMEDLGTTEEPKSEPETSGENDAAAGNNVPIEEIIPDDSRIAGNDHSEEEAVHESRARNIFDFAELMVYAFGLILLLFTFVARVTVVEGPSMQKTLSEGERLLISDIAYTPKNGDIVIFQVPGDTFEKPIVKRVIAVAGQTVDIDFDTWTLTIDGEVIDESDYRYIDIFASTVTSDYSFPITVPEGYVFVMGDNRNHSCDSRDNRIGLVDTRTILGHVLLRLSLSNFGPVK